MVEFFEKRRPPVTREGISKLLADGLRAVADSLIEGEEAFAQCELDKGIVINISDGDLDDHVYVIKEVSTLFDLGYSANLRRMEEEKE